MNKSKLLNYLTDKSRQNLFYYLFRVVQELLDHKDVKTTMIYTYVLNKGGKGVKSPVD